MSSIQPDVFVSYNWGPERLNQRRVMRFKTYLDKTEEVPVWMDTDQVLVGNQLDQAIEKGIRGCKVFIVCLTNEYAGSENCMKELNLAVTLKKPILPILFETMVWPPEGLGFHLSGSIYASFKNAKTAGEDVDFWTDGEMAKVLQEIGKYRGARDKSNTSIVEH